MATALKHTWTIARSLLTRNPVHCSNCSFICLQAQQPARSLSGLSRGTTSNVLTKTVSMQAPATQNWFMLQLRKMSSCTGATGLTSQQMQPSSNHALLKAPGTSLLTQACTPLLLQARGMKVKGVLARRCKSCRIVKRKNNKYVICDEHPRHKQKLLKQKGWKLPGVWNNKCY